MYMNCFVPVCTQSGLLNVVLSVENLRFVLNTVFNRRDYVFSMCSILSIFKTPIMSGIFSGFPGLLTTRLNWFLETGCVYYYLTQLPIVNFLDSTHQ